MRLKRRRQSSLEEKHKSGLLYEETLSRNKRMTPPFDGRAYAVRYPCPAGESKTIRAFTSNPATLAIQALGEGVTAFVEISISRGEFLEADEALWVAAEGFGEAGIVSNASTLNIIPSTVSAVRITATGGEVIVEFQQP